jgi:RNA exonuclease 4
MYFALDCEMVGVGPEGLDSALARVSIVNWDEQIVLDTYVRVTEPVTDYRTFVSGIREEHVMSEEAMPLDYVQNLVAGILRGKILIGHGLENDLKALCLNHPWTDIRDTAKYAPFMTKVELRSPNYLCSRNLTNMRPRKLKDLAYEKLGMEIQVMGVPHSPLEDAKAAMALYKSVRPEWEKDVAKAVSQSYQEPLSYPGTAQVLNTNPSSLLSPAQNESINVQNFQYIHQTRSSSHSSPKASTKNLFARQIEYHPTTHDVSNKNTFSHHSFNPSAQYKLSPPFNGRDSYAGFHSNF